MIIYCETDNDLTLFLRKTPETVITVTYTSRSDNKQSYIIISTTQTTTADERNRTVKKTRGSSKPAAMDETKEFVA
jgi:hypothetical protein